MVSVFPDRPNELAPFLLAPLSSLACASKNLPVIQPLNVKTNDPSGAGTIESGAHLEFKACRVETRENTKARAKVIFRRVTGFIFS